MHLALSETFLHAGLPVASDGVIKIIESTFQKLALDLGGLGDCRYEPQRMSILLRENPSVAAAIEEFLHGTQTLLGIVDRLCVEGAEAHVQSFMERYSKLLGLGPK